MHSNYNVVAVVIRPKWVLDGEQELTYQILVGWCTYMLIGLLLIAGDYLGGEVFWAGGLHLYTPLPFRPGHGGFGDLFRTHFFLNAGNLCNLNYGEL